MGRKRFNNRLLKAVKFGQIITKAKNSTMDGNFPRHLIISFSSSDLQSLLNVLENY